MTFAARTCRGDPGEEGAGAIPGIESDLDYLARRARQERELAAQAANPQAAIAHMYLAAAYATRIIEQTATPPGFEELLRQLD